MRKPVCIFIHVHKAIFVCPPSRSSHSLYLFSNKCPLSITTSLQTCSPKRTLIFSTSHYLHKNPSTALLAVANVCLSTKSSYTANPPAFFLPPLTYGTNAENCLKDTLSARKFGKFWLGGKKSDLHFLVLSLRAEPFFFFFPFWYSHHFSVSILLWKPLEMF